MRPLLCMRTKSALYAHQTLQTVYLAAPTRITLPEIIALLHMRRSACAK